MIRSVRPAPLLPLARRLLAALCSLGLLCAIAAPAAASPLTLQRSFANILNGPFDMVLSPISGGYTLARNLQEIDDTPGVRMTYALPGWVWLAGLNFGSGGIRIVTGVLEFVPGLIVFPFETDVDTLFDPVEDAGALVEWYNPLEFTENKWILYNPIATPITIPVKFGISYNAPGG